MFGKAFEPQRVGPDPWLYAALATALQFAARRGRREPSRRIRLRSPQSEEPPIDGEHDPEDGYGRPEPHGSPMRVERSATVADFMDNAGTFLEAREAEHNLIFGICSQVEADPSAYEGPPYLATVLHGDKVVGAALRTPPWRLVVSMLDHPGAAHRLADDLQGESLPGVVGPADAAGSFAEAWGETIGITPRVLRHERGFRLRRVIPPRPAPGTMIHARDEHRRLLSAWVAAFHEEALIDSPAQDFDRTADRWIKGLGRTAWLWVDRGRPVSLTGVGGPTPHGIRVGPVYTPPEYRGRGFASNLVAEVSQRQLDAGKTFVFLFTDLANPTSNKIYQAIGYEAVNDVDEWGFV
jgi:GNAT superfamily N-acetyltransferase